MNNQDYGIPNVDSSFPQHNNDIPMSFNGNENSLNLPQNNFPMNDVYYEDVNSKKTSSNTLNVPVPNPLEQNMGFVNNVGQVFNTSSEINQPYCAEFANENVSHLPFPGSFQAQEDQFVCNVSQPQIFTGQIPPTGFSSPSSLFSNADCSSNQPTIADSMENFPSTSNYLDTNSTSVHANMDLCDAVDTNVYPTSNGCSEVSASPFPLDNRNNIYIPHVSQSSENLPPSSISDSVVSASTSLMGSSSQNFNEVAIEGEQFYPMSAENVHGNDMLDPLEDGTPTQSGNESMPHCNREEPPSQSENHPVPQPFSGELPPQNCEVPHSNSEELFSHPVIDEPHSNNEELSAENSTQDNLLGPLQDESCGNSQVVSPKNVSDSPNRSEDAVGQCDKVTSENCTDTDKPDSACAIDGTDIDKPDSMFAIDKPTETTPSVSEELMPSSNHNIDQSVECGSTMETLDDLSDSLEKGIEASLEESCAQSNVDSAEANIPKPLSPMITALDGEFLTETKTEVTEEAEQSSSSVRLTRTRTGALPNKVQRYVDELYVDDVDDSSQDSILYEEWWYEEGAELEPSAIDPTVTVSEDVLKVIPRELAAYYSHFVDGVEAVLKQRLHCTACGKHIGASPNYIHIGNRHPVLRVLICNKCRSFYGVGKFLKDSDGSELFCRWCGQGGKVICCSSCPNVFCQPCLRRNLGDDYVTSVCASNFWACVLCNYEVLWPLRATCWALLSYATKRKKDAYSSKDNKKITDLQDDKSRCCTKKNKRRKPPSKTLSIRASSSVPESAPQDAGFQFGHFLFEGGDSMNVTGAENQAGDDEEYIDPSQFVQSVLEEPRRSQALPPRVTKPIMPRISPQVSIRPFQTRPGTSQMQHQPRPVVLQTNPPRQVNAVITQGPRLVVRQGNLMRPGLLPINNLPNSIAMPVRNRGPSQVLRLNTPMRPQNQNTVMRLDAAAGLQNAGKQRNPACVLNNMDGVRSMEQLQALDQVPWYRDGIDSVRAVGFALTKRIRELEARFYSLKNKQDIEKVMNLGRKLERLTERTEKRFNRINATLKNACREWCVQKMRNSPKSVDPFRFGKEETVSDWDDDAELNRPLEKVLIPVNSVSLQAGAIRPIQPRAISRTTPPPLAALVAPPPLIAAPGARPPLRQPLPSSSSAGFRVRLPGPKSSASRYVQVSDLAKRGSQNITQTVGALINKRNGPNSVSISLMPAAKRQRLNSNSSSSSDVMVCPTIPELLKMYNVKRCTVRLEKDDDAIVSFLERQENARLARSQSINEVEPVIRVEGEISGPEAEAIISSSEFPDHFLGSLVGISSTVEKQADTTDSTATSNVESNVDDDDDIEIIDEVSVSK